VAFDVGSLWKRREISYEPCVGLAAVKILGADVQCVVEEGDKFLTASFDQRTSLLRAEPAYGGLGYGGSPRSLLLSSCQCVLGRIRPTWIHGEARLQPRQIRIQICKRIISTMNTKEG